MIKTVGKEKTPESFMSNYVPPQVRSKIFFKAFYKFL